MSEKLEKYCLISALLLIIKAMQPLPFTISISEAKSLIRLSENVGELLDTEGD